MAKFEGKRRIDIYVPDCLYDTLAAASHKSRRNLTQEVIYRLERDLYLHDGIQPLLTYPTREEKLHS